jgi:hypothetical protein
MKVSPTAQTAYEFACHSAACAPPPAGSGGSTGGYGATMGGRGWKAVGVGSGRALRVTRYSKGRSVIHARESHFELQHKGTKVGEYTTPQQAADAADALK